MAFKKTTKPQEHVGLHKHEKKMSLRTMLIGTIIICWTMPMVLIMGSMSYYVSGQSRRQIDESVQYDIANSAYISSRNLQDLIDSSRTVSYDSTFKRAYNNYLEDENRIAFHDDVIRFLKNEYQYNSNIIFAVLYLTEEPDMLYYIQNPTLSEGYMPIMDYKENVHNNIINASTELETGFAFIEHENDIYMVRNVVDANFDAYAVIVFKLNIPFIFSSFEKSFYKSNSYFYINDVKTTFGEDNGKEIKLIPDFPNIQLATRTQEVIEEKNRFSVYGRYKLDRLDFKYAVEISKQGNSHMPAEFKKFFIISVVLIIPFMIIAIWFFYENIFKPIRQLNSATKIIQEGHLGYKIPYDVYNEEFTTLQEGFNNMSEQLKVQFERIYNEELALRDARIAALQSQINPHFLNNTLEIINWEARMAGNDKISGMIEALSIMLDAAMDRKSSPMVTIGQEFVYVDAYLYIVRERFGKRLKIVKDIDPASNKIKIPRLITQPIVENAIEHGITPQQTCIVLIKTYQDNENLFIEVHNNMPMSAENEKKVKTLLNPSYEAQNERSIHLGIYNVNTRLKIIYGEKASLDIFNSDNSTISKITIPLV